MTTNGRPSSYTDEVADQICARLAEGQSLRAICRDEEMPEQRSVFRWLRSHEGFRQQYALAREAQADALFDEALDIADDGSNDWMLANNGDDDKTAAWRLNSEHVQRSKLRIDTRKWMASKLQPKKYGEKVTNEIVGADGAPLIPVLNVTIGGTEPGASSAPGDGSE
jgi:hypothetical protein